MSSMNRGVARRDRSGESGFALILAILSLMLLTFLGLTLATTTSTELQIATNYRWSQQAYYNAEAGIEAGKVILRAIPNDWNQVLPPARTASTWPANLASPAPPPAPPASAPSNTPDQFGNPARNWANAGCDYRGGVGNGVILDDNAVGAALVGGLPKKGPYQNVTTIFGSPLNGAFTLWVRRVIVTDPGTGNLKDDTTPTAITPNALVLTSEGTAPYTTGAVQSFTAANRAVVTLQLTMKRAAAPGVCEAQRGQVGGAPSGSNFGACSSLTGGLTGSLGAAFGSQGGTLTDTGAQ